MNYQVVTYVLYLGLSIALTVWVARTLARNGRLFLTRMLGGDEHLADSVNHLLVVGFYLINLGYISLALKLSNSVESPSAVIESLSAKVGLVLLVLGVMHFSNLFVFYRLRREPARSSGTEVAQIGSTLP
jgi:hypothetical protein